MSPSYVNIHQEEFRLLVMKATLGRVLGRNIERAVAFWTLAFSFIIVVLQPRDPFYNPITHFVPLDVWAWAVAVLSATRVVVLIVNGWWPVTLQVRVAYSVATLMLVWSVLVTLSWVAIGVRGVVFPGVVLAPLAATIELLCFLALRTRVEAEKGAGESYVGRSVGSDSWWRRQPAAGDRERDSETA